MKLIILDRDGVINFDSDQFIKSPDEWKPIPGSLEAIARLTREGWRVVVATNQSGLARGLFEMVTLNAIHAKMHKAAAQAGGRIEAVLTAPMRRDDCDAASQNGMIDEIAQRAMNLGVLVAILRDQAFPLGAQPFELSGRGKNQAKVICRRA
jgi:D-glycero-D-manno-heptose 1,7-bisphosphate phosphatase